MTNIATMTAEELRNKAAIHAENARESFERCDTDGFLSQWASGLNRNLCETQAEIVENGGRSEFWGLFDLQGNRIAAKLIDGRYGLCWALCDANRKFTGRFIPFCEAAGELERLASEECPSYSGWVQCEMKVVIDGSDECLALRAAWEASHASQLKKSEKRVASWEKKHGFAQRRELAPAIAKMMGQGTGLSGRAWVATDRTDGGYPRNAKLA